MRLRGAVTAAFLIAMTTAAFGDPAGDDLLARAAGAPGLTSYTVPVHFDVHVIRPIGIRAGADGTAYYEAPGAAALVITHASGLLGMFFRGTYHLDLVPQTWPANYRVTASAPGDGGITLLTATPRTPGGVDHVVFRIGTLGADAAPVTLGAVWTYKDGSTVALSFTNGPAGAYTLPRAATVTVNMPHQQLDAAATYGTYALNAPIPRGVLPPQPAPVPTAPVPTPS
jgi:hypothetical protein